MIELNRSRNNVVLSRRAVLEDERKEMRQAILDRLNPGDVVEGTISNIVDFGAFVDLDGMDGLIHISELSWSHVNHPSEVLEIGQTVRGQGARHRPRPPADLARPQADPDRPVAAGARQLPGERRRPGQGDEGGHVRGVRRDPPRRRGPRAHLGARAAPRREPARDRLAGRRRQRPHPRGRRRAAPPLALAEAGRGRDAGTAEAGRRGGASCARPLRGRLHRGARRRSLRRGGGRERAAEAERRGGGREPSPWWKPRPRPTSWQSRKPRRRRRSRRPQRSPKRSPPTTRSSKARTRQRETRHAAAARGRSHGGHRRRQVGDARRLRAPRRRGRLERRGRAPALPARTRSCAPPCGNAGATPSSPGARSTGPRSGGSSSPTAASSTGSSASCIRASGGPSTAGSRSCAPRPTRLRSR